VNPSIRAVRVSAFIAAAALVTTGVAQAADPSPSGDPIVLGYSIAKTGGFSPYDLAKLAGAQMAVEEINAAGGLLGRPVEIIDYDTTSDLNQSAPGAQDLLGRGADFMFATSDYDFGGPAIREAVNAGKVGIGFAGDPLFGYHGIGPLAFNVHPGSPAEGAANAEFAAGEGWLKAYTLTDTINSYPSTITSYFKTRFAELGGTIVGEDLFNQADTSIATQITALREANPDVILVASFPPGGASAVKQIRAAGITAPILGTAAFDGSSWIGSVPGLTDMYNPKLSSGDGNDPSQTTNDFFAAYEQAAGEKALIPSYLAAGYVEVKLMAEGVTQAGSTDGPAVAAAISQLSDFQTILGPLNYAARAECNMPQSFEFKFFKVNDGVEEFVKTVAPTVPPVDC
jgi:branched-chain amino acid transport system substrate-binding protein